MYLQNYVNNSSYPRILCNWTKHLLCLKNNIILYLFLYHFKQLGLVEIWILQCSVLKLEYGIHVYSGQYFKVSLFKLLKQSPATRTNLKEMPEVDIQGSSAKLHNCVILVYKPQLGNKNPYPFCDHVKLFRHFRWVYVETRVTILNMSMPAINCKISI